MEKENTSAKAPEPEFAEKFDVKLFGLTLCWRDNLVCLLPVALAVALQIRFNQTVFAEGFFALFAFIAYVVMRLWLVNRRFPEPGQIEVDVDSISIPASLANGQPEKIQFADITRLQLFLYHGRQGFFPTSLVIWRGFFWVRIPWLAADLEALIRVLEARNCRMSREPYSPAVLIALLALVGLLLVAFTVWKQN